MLKQKKLLLISSSLILMFSCISENFPKIILDKEENIRYNDDFVTLGKKINLINCYECEEDNVFIFSPDHIKVNTADNENINSIYYLYFDTKNKLKQIEKVFLFDYDIKTNEILTNSLEVLNKQIYEINKLDSIEKKIEKNGFVYSIKIDTNSIYKTLTYKITTANTRL